jgi:hypothetical protein
MWHMRKTIPKLFVADMSPEVMSIDFKTLASMTLQDRARITFELSDNIRDTAVAGIRALHPDFDDRQIRMELIRWMHGIDLDILE